MTHKPTLINQVKASFLLKNTTFNRFCLDKGIDPSNAKKALSGDWKGEKASEIVTLISNETGIEMQP